MSDHHDHDGDHEHGHEHGHEHDLGLAHDLPRLVSRRRLLGLLTGAGALTLAGCAAAATGTTTGATTATGTTTGEIPEETAGPYPGDGSNGPNVLTESGVVRGDIRSSFGSLSGTAPGVPLTITLTMVDAASGAALPGATVYLWHCDRDGRYSLYDVADQNYLRGVQEADANGRLTFTTIFPAAYSGRWPHAHFEVYPDLAAATTPDNATVTSQLALPQDVCEAVYATDGYSASVRNLARTSLERDMVFSDGYASQLATVTGDLTTGLAATLTVGVDA
ncbi:intradiol ring-cleavage dioxygenase [Pseudonocardia sp. KRD-184]|uniref:Intradiol ring-cleavage dioxygenase n=1 Tax=Pseudonocardia oceani TaxID=2792013 RepID=A0ABS6UKF9_9PSEU|nr:intradiol ring-cleavage dioxygenase [Pseudonocardia oceani]MBW0091987.1 intradiol ring-cleavage dioxygenase [Pseudonocardia oceani]MBW0098765.1 intradiol ring-cleavage dioxygenase [Pseudonocardia oceani]MBW0111277.1 intradiol ring-cleavage dioxygenase [Pseudonocardia oceani]MBW0124037.1 intradiol ring-cleavage dioxygenase [Pseudonocardia oceani]MBW0132388.1 intradiol ring-cleavage dioxygenase [Pseudonocardia oceani]